MRLKRKSVLTSAAVGILGLSAALGQGAAPSSHLFYKGGNTVSDITMNQVYVPITAPYTYFEALGWNNSIEGGGYCGIQDIGNGGRKYIFSLWNTLDPNNTTPIKAAYLGQGTTVSSFGNEGTGLGSSNTELGWSVNTWYNFVSRTWQVDGHTYFGFWSQDLSTSKWTHLLTMDYPVANVTFNTKNDAFVEDWADLGAPIRKALYKEAWQRDVGGAWTLQNQALFSSNDKDAFRNKIYDESFNSGVENGAFFIQIGGNTSHAFSGRTLDLSVPSSATKPTTVPGEVGAFTAAYNAATKTVDAAWDVNALKSPQFSYQLDLFDNAQFTGSPVASSSANVPQARALSMNVSFLGGVYYARFRIKDIFDNASVQKTATLTLPSLPVCTDAWNAATAYVGGSTVSRQGNTYASKWWTQGEDPVLKSGAWDVWKPGSACKNADALPTVAIVSPAADQYFYEYPSAPTPITVTVKVNDDQIPIDSVQYVIGETARNSTGHTLFRRFTVLASPFSVTYLPQLFSTSGFTQVSATSFAGKAGSTPASRIFNVRPLPELTIASPEDNSSVPPSAASIFVDVTVNDFVLPIDSVVYTVVDTRTTGMSGVSITRKFKVASPYDLSFPVVSGNTFTRVTAVAYGDNGKASAAKSVQINYNAAPAITVTSPIPFAGNNNATYLVGGSLTISADVTDPDGGVVKVEISRGGGNTVTLTAAPYTATFANLPAPAPDGSIYFNVKAYDNKGATATALIVAYKNRVPLIAITAPAGGTVFAPGATVNISVLASDVDGAVARVEYFNGTTKIGTMERAPFSFSFAIGNAAAGDYALTAKATDNMGSTATSSVVSFSVKASGCATAAWNAATAYVAGNRVSEKGNVYEAKWWTQGEEPVLKSGTWDVWKLIGACAAP
jgi:chitodextrinase